MAKGTSNTTTAITESLPALPDAQAALARLVGEAAALRAALTGTVHTPTIRREEQPRVTATGQVARVLVDVVHDDVRQVGALERVQARRRLAAVEEEMKAAEEAVEVARQRDAEARRTARAALITEGEALVRREVPELVGQQRRLQRAWNDLQTRCEALDQRLGQQRFAESAWPSAMAPNAQFDGFVHYLRESYGVDLD